MTDKFLWAAGDNEIGTTGGERNHTLTNDELPQLSGKFANILAGSNAWQSGIVSGFKDGGAYTVSGSSTVSMDANDSFTISFGKGYSHNNMPPFVGVYCWKRTA